MRDTTMQDCKALARLADALDEAAWHSDAGVLAAEQQNLGGLVYRCIWRGDDAESR
jgi:hypothetical protein